MKTLLSAYFTPHLLDSYAYLHVRTLLLAADGGTTMLCKETTTVPAACAEQLCALINAKEASE